MRGLLSLHRGLYTLSHRQARKARIVAARCDFCGTVASSKVRSERLPLLDRCRQLLGLLLLDKRTALARASKPTFVRCGCSGKEEGGDAASNIRHSQLMQLTVIPFDERGGRKISRSQLWLICSRSNSNSFRQKKTKDPLYFRLN